MTKYKKLDLACLIEDFNTYLVQSQTNPWYFFFSELSQLAITLVFAFKQIRVSP